MKKLMFCLITVFLSFLFMPDQLRADVSGINSSVEMKHVTEKAKANVLLARLEIIKEMDKSKMNSVEKKSLRNEVNSIKRQLKTLGGGIYLSLSAIIIILLLIILL